MRRVLRVDVVDYENDFTFGHSVKYSLNGVDVASDKSSREEKKKRVNSVVNSNDILRIGVRSSQVCQKSCIFPFVRSRFSLSLFSCAFFDCRISVKKNFDAHRQRCTFWPIHDNKQISNFKLTSSFVDSISFLFFILCFVNFVRLRFLSVGPTVLTWPT